MTAATQPMHHCISTVACTSMPKSKPQEARKDQPKRKKGPAFSTHHVSTNHGPQPPRIPFAHQQGGTIHPPRAKSGSGAIGCQRAMHLARAEERERERERVQECHASSHTRALGGRLRASRAPSTIGSSGVCASSLLWEGRYPILFRLLDDIFLHLLLLSAACICTRLLFSHTHYQRPWP